jgi:uncharacterized LabA/DUF88 family protein
MPIRTTFYIDGFNFYNGLKSAIRTMNPAWKQYYWIDFVEFAKQFLSPLHELVAVKYFTATPLDPGKERRQSALFKANKYRNGDAIEFIKGKYYKKPIRCQGLCRQNFFIYEEKRTDVNISVEIMGDCAFDKTDLIVLISADSDLVPTLEYVIGNFPAKRLKVFFPPCRKSTDLMTLLKNNGQSVVFLDTNELKFKKARMPNDVVAGGTTTSIPSEWV